MKTLLFTTLFIFSVLYSVSQTSNQETPTVGLTLSDYKALINKQFRLLLTGNGENSAGSFAALDLAEKRVTFAPAFVLQNQHLIGAKLNAGISDDFAEIFSNDALNKNFSLDVDYNLLSSKNAAIDPVSSKGFQKIFTDYDERMAFAVKRSEGLEEFLKDSIDIFCCNKYKKVCDSLECVFKKIKEQIKEQEDCLQDSTLTRVQRDSVYCLLQQLRIDYQIARRKLENCVLNEEDWQQLQLTSLYVKYGEILEKYDPMNLTVYGFKLRWFSFGTQIKTDMFKLFEPDLTFPERIIDKDFTSFQFRVKHNWYSWFHYTSPNRRTWYLQTGITYNYRSNYQELTSSEVTITKDYGNDLTGTQSMSAEEKYSVYSGNYRADVHEMILTSDFYFFVNNRGAIHLTGNLKFVESTPARLNMGLGLLYPIKNKEKDRPIINAELFLNLSNMFYNPGSNFYLSEAAKLGLRFTAPFSFTQN